MIRHHTRPRNRATDPVVDNHYYRPDDRRWGRDGRGLTTWISGGYTILGLVFYDSLFGVCGRGKMLGEARVAFEDDLYM